MNNPNLLINSKQQTMSALDIAYLWAGISICLPSFMLGGLLIPALSFNQALLITILGNALICLLITLMGIPGVKQGWSSPYLSRRIFGHPYGAVFPTLVITLSMAGWGAIMLDITSQALAETIPMISRSYFLNICIILTGVIIIFSTLAGPKAMKTVNKLGLPALCLWFAWTSYLFFSQYQLTSLLSYHPTGTMNLFEAFDLVMGGTIAGIYVSSDLGRFARNRSALTIGVIAGSLPASVLLAVLGMFSQLTTGSWNPVPIIKYYGMGIPALLLVILSTWTTNQAILYSGSLALINLLPRLKPKYTIIVLGLLMTCLALAGITNYFVAFLQLLDYLLAPFIGVALVDNFLFNTQQRESSFNWLAFLAMSTGLLCALSITVPIPSSIFSLLLSGSLYYLLKKLFRTS